uniref:Heme-binding protein 1 n=1 Tax=Parasteatoda tepidariorum TaxID=114398 RepID=A0A2L2Y5V6_PARTP
MAFLKYMKGAIVGSEQPKYEVISKTDDYELRSYPECQWVTLSIHDKTPDDFSRDDFRRLFDYISGKNEASLSIDMTVPVVYHVSPVEEKAKDYSVSFFLPSKLESPPNPLDNDLALSETGAREMYVRTFGGMAKDADWKKEFETLKSKIENPDDVDLSEYHRAGYDPPFKPFNRRNEVWIVKKTSSVVDPQTPTD